MLRSVNDLRGLTIQATDDEIGKVDQFLFDDKHWTVRYMVVNTGGWLFKDLVLLSPRSIGAVEWDERRIDVKLTREQVKNAPDISTDEPVSRQKEEELAAYYDYAPYWYGPSVWGEGGYPFGGPDLVAAMAAADKDAIVPETPTGDPHLRSTREVTGYRIHASDGEIGHVSDIMMDDTSWTIKYLVVDTGDWLPGKHVLIAPSWATEISWDDQSVVVNRTRQEVKDAPEEIQTRPA